ncbi:hypothetical protein GB937_006626 [Aspergillus fischeri]|nr:hypothetical protein GB937_006626 [Aspergillus fischeri]
MTIGHPQNPYPKWFSENYRSEDSKHWLRSETLRPLSALRQDDSSPLCLVSPVIVALQLPLSSIMVLVAAISPSRQFSRQC